MAEVKIELRIRAFEEKHISQVKSMFYGTIFPFVILGNEVSFYTKIRSEEVNIPDTVGKANDIWVYFVTDLPVEIDIDNNDVYYYDGDRNIPANMISVPKLKSSFKHGCLDEDFGAQLELFCLSMFYSSFLAFPSIDLNSAHFKTYLNERLFREKRYCEYAINQEAYEDWPEIFKSNLNISQTWAWVIKNGISCTSKPACPVVSLLYYLFNREFFEIMLFSVIGLETLYGDKRNKTGKSYTMQNRINAVFPEITKEQINEMYKHRSSIAHGEGEIASAIVWLDLVSNNKEYEETAILSSALFLESIRMLISKNATHFVFREKVDVSYGFE
ncbi:MAG: hypothetical protein J5537_00240 [Lachnospiraceae bacterium]|nr:hypothetical protein [Lachnospiraceae bacterium]